MLCILLYQLPQSVTNLCLFWTANGEVKRPFTYLKPHLCVFPHVVLCSFPILDAMESTVSQTPTYGSVIHLSQSLLLRCHEDALIDILGNVMPMIDYCICLYLAISYWIIWWYPPVSATQTSVAKCLITTHKEILHVYKTRHSGTNGYRQVSNITRTKFQHLKDYRTVLRLSVRNPLKPDVKSRMKM